MSKFSDSELRAAFQAAAADLPGSETELDAEHIGAVARGVVTDADAVRAVIDRCSADPEVAEVWRLAVALHEAAPQVSAFPDASTIDADSPAQLSDTSEPAHPSDNASFAANVAPLFRHRAVFAVLAVAAVALIAIGLGAVGGGGGGDDGPAYRGPGVDGPSSPAPVSVDAGEPVELTWRVSNAVRWRLVISDAALKTIHRAEPVGERYVLPGSVTDGRSGEQLLWRAEAVQANGSVKSSPTFTLSVR